MLPLFQSQQCDPYALKSDQCTQGNLVAYSLNVSDADHVASVLEFS